MINKFKSWHGWLLFVVFGMDGCCLLYQWP